MRGSETARPDMSIGPVDIEFVLKGDLQGRMKQVGSTIKGEAGAMNKQMTRLTGSTETLGKGFTKLRGLAQTMLPVASVAAAGLAFKKLAKDVYAFSNDFSKAMREVQTISTAVQNNFKGISEEIINMAATGPDNAIKLAQAYYQVVSAGYDGAEGLKVLEVSSKAATAGITDTKTAADGITTVLNAWGKSFTEAEAVADAMFKTVEKGKTTFPELASSMAQVAPIASTLKIPFEEIMALTASLTKQGTPTAEAMTQIRSALVGLSKELGGDIFQKGKTVQQVFEDVAKSAGYSIEELAKVTGRIEGASAILATTGEKAKAAAEDLEAIGDSAKSMSTAYRTMLQEADNQWSMVHNKWQRELKSLGGELKNASLGWAQFFNAVMASDADSMDILESGINGWKSRLAALNALRGDASEADKVLAFWSSIIYGPLAFLDPNSSMFKVIFGNNKKIEEALKNSLTVQKEIQKQNEAWKRTDTASIITEIGDIDQKIRKEQELLSFYESRGVNNPEIELIQLRIEGYANEKRVWENLLAAKKQGATTKIGGQEEDEVVSQFEAMQEELKALQKQILDADEQQQKKIAERIIELQKELSVRVKIVDEALKAARAAAYGTDRGTQKITTRGVDDIGETFKKSQKEVKATGLEVDKLNKKIKEGEAYAKKLMGEFTGDGLEKFLQNSQEVLAVTGQIVDRYKENLGLTEEQAKVIDDGLQAMSGIADIAAGNYIQGAAKLVDSAISMFVKVPEEMSVAFVQLEEQVQKVLQSIELAGRTMANLGNTDVLKAIGVVNTQLNTVAKNAKDLNEELEGKSYGQNRRGGTSVYYGKITREVADLNAEIEKLTTRLLEGQLSDDQRKAIEAVLESYNMLLQQIDTITQDLTGTTVNELANSLSEAFLIGTEAAESWGNAVDDIIKHVITRQLTASLIAGPVQEAIDKLIADTEGGLTTDEANRFKETIENLAESVGPAFDEARKALESIGIDMGGETSAQGMTGAIRALTEETGGMIYGQLMGIRYDLKGIVETMAQQDEEVVQRNLAYMAEIAANTRYNQKLNSIDDRLREMNIYLKNI